MYNTSVSSINKKTQWGAPIWTQFGTIQKTIVIMIHLRDEENP